MASTNPKRLKQTHIFDVPPPRRSAVEITKEADELPNVEIHAKVYAYCETNPTGRPSAELYPLYDPTVHGRVVYVGQTTQSLQQRDKQHKTDKDTQFDRHYDGTQCAMVLLKEQRFAAAKRDADFKDQTLHPAGAWMDHWERRYISEFDTYATGLNRTKGGQGRGWLVAMREGKAKASYALFRDVYMPALRTRHEKTGSANAPQSDPVLGHLVSDIRTGHTQIPPQFEEELMTMRLDLSNQQIAERDKRWEQVYMPAFRTRHEKTGSANAPQSDPVLGHLVSDIRTGHTQIPPQFEEELMTMRLDLSNQQIAERDKRWEQVYMPAFRTRHEKTGSANAPQSDPVLGHLVNNIRKGRSQIPPQFEEELMAMRFFYSTSNLAVHVSRVLDIPCKASLADDPRTKQVAEEAARHHAALLRLRAGLDRKKRSEAGLARLPFGTTPMGGGWDRFLADLKLAASSE